MTTIEFEGYGKTPRFYRGIVITEKIDGTNAGLHIREVTDETPRDEAYLATLCAYVEIDGVPYDVAAQSRKRLITPQSDNFGFAHYVKENAETLVRDLGEGLHFGEWWGQGIQRTYGQKEKFFSLFNAGRWADAVFETPRLSVVPTMYEGEMDDAIIGNMLMELLCSGSAVAHEDWKGEAEGIIIFHTQSRQVYKVLLHNDDRPKTMIEKLKDKAQRGLEALSA